MYTSTPAAAITAPVKEKYFAPDFVRAVAIVLVIVVHVVCPYLNDFSHEHVWRIGNFIESAARPCVPLFFMLTGFLLLDSQSSESVMAFYKKRFGRILIPFFFWAAVYFAWRHFHHHEPMHFSKMLKELYSGPIFYHFGFMFTLISLYLITPFMRVLVRGISHRNLLWLLTLWFAGQTVPAISLKFFHIYCSYPLELVTRYSGYFVAGYCFARIKLSGKQALWLSLLALTGYAATVAGTQIINAGPTTKLDEFFYDYLSPNVIVASVSLFVLLLNAGHKLSGANPIFKRVITAIGSTTLGIYLMQSLIIEVVNVPWQGVSPLLYVPGMTAYVLAVCVVICTVLSRVPVLKKVI
jgi:surface polysaccharide O-acyltransferase-like enzyme